MGMNQIDGRRLKLARAKHGPTRGRSAVLNQSKRVAIIFNMPASVWKAKAVAKCFRSHHKSIKKRMAARGRPTINDDKRRLQIRLDARQLFAAFIYFSQYLFISHACIFLECVALIIETRARARARTPPSYANKQIDESR